MEAKNVKIALVRLPSVRPLSLLVPVPDSFSISFSMQMDLGFSTHSVHMNARLVYLPVQVSEDRKTLTVSAPIDGRVYPPGPGFVFVVVDGVPSKGQKVMVGDGKGPKVDEAAIQGRVRSVSLDASRLEADSRFFFVPSDSLLSNTAPPPP